MDNLPIVCLVVDDEYLFVLDSGLTEHINKSPMLAEDFKLMRIGLVKRGIVLEARTRGTIKMMTNENKVMQMKDVSYIPQASHNIISA